MFPVFRSQIFIRLVQVVRAMAILQIVLLLTVIAICPAERVKKPNIVFMLIDDLGWNDVSFHGSKQIPTPNMDVIARDGIILNQYYTQMLCSPCRGALMTGKYPIRTGLQHSVIIASQPSGLPLEEKLLPEYLKSLNYETHAVGKWHLGSFKSEYLPQNRGFDSFFGYWNALEDYFSHFSRDENFTGLDLHYDCENLWQYSGVYGTELYTARAKKIIKEHNPEKPLFLYLAQQAVHSGNFDTYPLQCPEKYTKPFTSIGHEGRRTFAGMVSAMDQSVGEIFAALEKSGMLNETIFIVSTDNGGAVEGMDGTYGSNYPLRGAKNTLWEGGVRGVSFIWSPFLRTRSRIYNGLMHVSDWLPTILSAVGGHEALTMLTDNENEIDGIDHWPSITQGVPSSRKDILLNIDDILGNYAIRKGNFKLINGSNEVENFDGWFNQEGMSMKNHSSSFTPLQKFLHWTTYFKYLKRSKAANILWEKYGKDPLLAASCQTLECKQQLEVKCGPRPIVDTCNSTKEPCLFDVVRDPCELVNLAKLLPKTVKKLENSVNRYRRFTEPPGNVPSDPESDPALYGNAWVPWKSSCNGVRGVCMSYEENEEECY